MPLVLLVIAALSIDVPVPLDRDVPDQLVLRRPFHLHNPAPDEHGKTWRPITRTRTIHAWRLSEDRARLHRAPTLDARCPKTGYAFFTPFEAWSDAVGPRARVQGRGGRLAPCPKGPSDSCFDLDACR